MPDAGLFLAAIAWLAALVCSSVGLAKANSRQAPAPHRGLAIAGLVIAVVEFVLFVVLVVLFLWLLLGVLG